MNIYKITIGNKVFKALNNDEDLLTINKKFFTIDQLNALHAKIEFIDHYRQKTLKPIINKIEALGIGADVPVSGSDAVDLLNDILDELKQINQGNK
jgi:hypothetical protein